MRIFIRLIVVSMIGFLAVACATRVTTFLNPQVDFNLIQRVAVLPLENLTNDSTAGEKVRQLLIIEMLASGSVEVVDIGEVARAARTLSISNVVTPGAEEIRKLGTELKVQAVIGGSVQEFSQGRAAGAQATSVALVFRMIEIEKGEVIWTSSVSRSGVGAMSRLFGVGGDSATDRARELIDTALHTLIK